MNATASERTDVIAGLLREYAAKLTELNRELLQLLLEPHHAVSRKLDHVAWLLDRAKRYDLPMRELVNEAARLFEAPWLDEDHASNRIEYSLRLGETEAQLHHMIRAAYQLQKQLDEWKVGDQVARLRESAGLNAMKGGPLRPTG